MKKKLACIIILTIIIVTIGFVYYDSTTLAPNRIKVRTETISSEDIPESLDDLKILFFADLHYNAFMDKERFEKIVLKINKQHPDVVIFGGDLFDHPSQVYPTDQIQQELTDLLSDINAPLGKYAVWGNHDLESPKTKSMIEQIFINADFEVLENHNIELHNNTQEYINLIGLDSGVLGNIDTVSSFEGINNDAFNLVVCHTPDSFELLDEYRVDLMLSGHSHGGQVYLPIVGSLYKPPLAEIYNKGIYNVNDSILDVSDGLGTTRYDIRFLSDPEIVIYRLESTN